MWRLSSLLLLAVLLAGCVAPISVPWNSPAGPPPVSPLIPNQVPVLLENQWRLIEVIHNGTQHEFDAVEPVLVTFHPGILALRACNSIAYRLDTRNVANPDEYRFYNSEGTARGCEDGGTEQEINLSRALRDTNRYEVQGDRLILSGQNAQLTFVIDNEATKPPGWW